jgi:hypothetical protein
VPDGAARADCEAAAPQQEEDSGEQVSAPRNKDPATVDHVPATVDHV